jgi:hypothetical protein
MEWISVKDRLPTEERWCWVCGADNDVFHALFHFNCKEYKDGKIKIISGFAVENLEDFDNRLENISHWMPYYTPQPPK